MGPPEGSRILQLRAITATIDKQLLRHAATYHAGSADAVLFGDGDTLAQLCG